MTEKPKWTELEATEKSELLKRVCEGDVLSAREMRSAIAEYLGPPHPSRNAIIGHINRWEPEGVRLHRPNKSIRAMAVHNFKRGLHVKKTPTPKPQNIMKKRRSRKSDPGFITVEAQSTFWYKPFKAGALPRQRDIGVESLNLRLVDIGPRQCRYATNDAAIGEEHLFCGRLAKVGSPYCPGHDRLCHPARGAV